MNGKMVHGAERAEFQFTILSQNQMLRSLTQLEPQENHEFN